MSAFIQISFHLLIFAGNLSYLAQTSYAQGEELFILTDNSHSSFNPLEQKFDEISYPFYFVHNPIFSLNRKNQWTCRLCKEFPTVENRLIEVLDGSKNSYDLKIMFEFSRKSRWGDGKPVNGYDLYFTWQVASSLGHRYLGKHFFNRIQQISVDSNDPRKVTVYLRGKSSFYSDWGEITLLPRHIEKKVWIKYQNHPNSYFRHSNYRTNPYKPGLYSGYYYPTAKNTLKINSKIPVVQLPYNIIKITRPKDLLRLGNQNEFMIPEALPKNYADTYKQAKIKSNQFHNEIWGDSINFEHVTLNLRNPILKDKRIRKALSHGFDKNILIREVYNNSASPAAHFLAPQYQGFNHKIPLYEFNPEKSAELLDEAEWVYNETSGVRHKMGKPLELSLLTNYDSQRIAAARFLAESWKKIGVKVEIKTQKNSQFWNSIERKAFDGMIMFAWQLPVERSYYPLFSSNAVPNIRNHYQGQNICGWVNKKVDQILFNLKREFSNTRRMDQLKSLQEIFAKEVPMIPLFQPNQVALVPTKLKNFYISGNQFPSSHYVQDWLASSKTSLSSN